MSASLSINDPAAHAEAASPRTDFLADLEQQLRLSGRPFSRADVLAFVADCWPWIAEDPSPVVWALAFLEAHPAAKEAA